MLDSLYAKLIGIGAILALLLGAYLWVYHQVASAQQAVDQKTITALQGELDASKAAASNCGHALDQVNADAKQAQADAAQSAAKTQVALNQAKSDAVAAAKSAATWQAKFRAAAASQGCASIKEQSVCPELFEPLPSH